MEIGYENTWAMILSASEEERAWLDTYVSCEEKRYRPGRYGVEAEYGRFSMLSPQGQFPAGFVAMLERAGKRDGVEVVVRDGRGGAPGARDVGADLAWLRPYQLDAVEALSAAGRGLCKAPTGAGKTEIIIALTRAFPTVEWAFLVHRIDLVGQTADRYLKRTGETAGTVSSAGWKRGTGNLTVASFQTVYDGLRSGGGAVEALRLGVRGVLVDEAHAQSAETYNATVLAFDRAYFRYGFSGTPLKRGDRASLQTIGALGPVVYSIEVGTLVAAGVVAKPEIRMIPLEQEDPAVIYARKQWELDKATMPAAESYTSRFRPPHRTWRQVYQSLVVESKARNTLLADIAEKAAKPSMLFVEESKQGRALEKLLAARGLAVKFVHGSYSLEERKRRLVDLASGKLDVVLCTAIFTEGVDVPELRSVIVGGGKAAAVAALQRLGRGMRKVDGKHHFELWDIADKGQKWLHRHARERYAAYRGEGHEVLLGWPKP